MESLLTFCQTEVPVWSSLSERVISECLVDGRVPIIAQNQFLDLIEDPLLLFGAKEDLQKLLAVIPGGLM